jgi:hypothetical protein
MMGQEHSATTASFDLQYQPERDRLVIFDRRGAAGCRIVGHVLMCHGRQPTLDLTLIGVVDLLHLLHTLQAAPQLARLFEVHHVFDACTRWKDMRYVLEHLENDLHWLADTEQADRLWLTIGGRDEQEEDSRGAAEPAETWSPLRKFRGWWRDFFNRQPDSTH